ncbi:MAG: DUF86 domain-containing protein [Myxococcota bacterium]
MSRDVVARLDDMIDAAQLIIEWTRDATGDDLQADIGLRYQIERALEVLGEAAKHVPDPVRAMAPGFPWRKACGLRDMLAHAYFDIDPDVLSAVGLDALPAALPALFELRARIGGERSGA